MCGSDVVPWGIDIFGYVVKYDVVLGLNIPC